jgi:D-sedoheptulose 7-phosphate isomerase
MTNIKQIIQESIQTKETLYSQLDLIEKIIDQLVHCFQNGNKLLICGNGGSAADAQHVAAEFVGRFFLERAAVPAIALTANTSTLTAIPNDYSYDIVFARQVEAFAQPGDVFVGISTSGNSKNVVLAAQAAQDKGCYTIGLTGLGGGKLNETVDLCLGIASKSTPRVQEAHILVWHIICELVEEALFSEPLK